MVSICSSTLAPLVLCAALLVLSAGCNLEATPPAARDRGTCPDRGPCPPCPEAGSCLEAGSCPDSGPCPDGSPCPEAAVPDMKIQPDAPPPPPPFPMALGGTLDDEGKKIALDGSGNIYLAGIFRGTGTFGKKTLTAKGAEDVFVAKISPKGVVIWATAIGGKNNEDVTGFAVDSAGYSYLTGTYKQNLTIGTTPFKAKGSSDIFIAKLKPDGKVAWAQTAGGVKSDYPKDIAVDWSGNVYLLAHIYTSATFVNLTVTTTYARSVVAKLASTGATFSWIKNYSGNAQFRGIAADSSMLYLSGRFRYNVAFGKESVSGSGSFSNLFWLKMNHQGLELKASAGGSSCVHSAGEVVVDSSGYTYITGRFCGSAAKFGTHYLAGNGSEDVFLTRVSPSGSFDWVLSGGGSYYDIAEGVAINAAGDVAVAGRLKHKGTFGAFPVVTARDKGATLGSIDIVAARTTKAGGTWKAVHHAGGFSSDYGAGVALDKSGNMYVTGKFTGKATFGSTTLTSRGHYDGFIWKIAP